MASTTAEFMALFRALESARHPRNARLFEDPWAAGFLGAPLRVVAAAARIPLLEGLIRWVIDVRWPGARPSGVARTRWIDDELREALTGGVRQVLILGAGFDAAAPSFILWEGVTNYLTAEGVDTTLRTLARGCAPKSRVLFTYVHRGLLDGTATFGDTAALGRMLRRVKEPWTFGLVPAELSGYLADRGLALVRDLGSTEIRARYLGPGARQLRGYEFYRAALAEVAVPMAGSERDVA